MQTIIYSCGAVGTVFGVIAAVMFSTNHKILGIWISFAAIVVLLLALAVYLHDEVIKGENVLSSDNKKTATPTDSIKAHKSDSVVTKNQPNAKKRAVKHIEIPQKPKDSDEQPSEVKSIVEQNLPQVLKLSFVTETIPSSKQDFPYALKVVVQTNMPIAPTHIRVIANGEIGHGDFGFDGPAMITNIRYGHQENIFELFFESPPVTPQRPLIVFLWSKTKINVDNIVVIP
jgi:hypothetical protein